MDVPQILLSQVYISRNLKSNSPCWLARARLRLGVLLGPHRPECYTPLLKSESCCGERDTDPGFDTSLSKPPSKPNIMQMNRTEPPPAPRAYGDQGVTPEANPVPEVGGQSPNPEGATLGSLSISASLKHPPHLSTSALNTSLLGHPGEGVMPGPKKHHQKTCVTSLSAAQQTEFLGQDHPMGLFPPSHPIQYPKANPAYSHKPNEVKPPASLDPQGTPSSQGEKCRGETV